AGMLQRPAEMSFDPSRTARVAVGDEAQHVVKFVSALRAERRLNGLGGLHIESTPLIEDQAGMLGRVIVVGNRCAFAGHANDRTRGMVGMGLNISHVLAKLQLDEDWERLDRLLFGLNLIGRMAQSQVVSGENKGGLALAEGLAINERAAIGMKEIPLGEVLEQRRVGADVEKGAEGLLCFF